MATQLLVYQRALTMLGERRLTSLTEDRPPRYWLDDAWNGSVQLCLEETDWWSFILTVKIDADPELETSFGWTKVHNKPTDWGRTSGVYQDEHLFHPLRDYLETSGGAEGNNYYSDLETIYLQYIPDLASILSRIAAWPEYFADYVASELAIRIAPEVKSVKEIDLLTRQQKKIKNNAKSLDAMKRPSKPLPEGSWTRAARLGGYRRGPQGYNF